MKIIDVFSNKERTTLMTSILSSALSMKTSDLVCPGLTQCKMFGAKI